MYTMAFFQCFCSTAGSSPQHRDQNGVQYVERRRPLARSLKLTAPQKIFLLGLLADGYTTTQVNIACSHFKPPFEITDTTATYYRRKAKIKYLQRQEEALDTGWSDGLARKEERIKVLKRLAERMMRDLLRDDPAEEKIWLDNLKGLGQGPNFFTFPYKDFNHQQVIQLRGILEDIAKEVGQRSTKIDMTTNANQGEIAQIRIPAENLAPAFLSVYRAVKAGTYHQFVLKGGRGSTKSSFASQMIIELLHNNPEVHAVVLRQVANTLRDSVYAQLCWAIGQMGLTEKFKTTTSPLEIEYLPTHQKIYFRGADDPGKLKSIKPSFGYIAIAWFEELDQFKGPEAVRKIEQSLFRGGDLAWEFKTYNPPRTSGNWVNKYVQIPKPGQLIHDSNFLTVPSEWLGQVFIDEAEHLHQVNPDAYDHEYLGVVNGMGGQVFANVTVRTITDKEISQFDRLCQGIDWGFYPDPFHWVKVHYDAARMDLYIFDEYRANKKKNKDAWAALVNEKKVTVQDLIVADSAEPKSVADFKEYGATIRAAEKGPESVTYSMKWLQSLNHIYIDGARAPYATQEFVDYELETDKDGEYISEYPDKNNHAIDATRYSTNLIWRRRGE